MKQHKKLLAGFLALCMLLVMVPWSLPAYAETSETETTETEPPIERIEFEPIALIEHTNGDWISYYNEETGAEEEYFHYYIYPQYTVYLKDGTTLKSDTAGDICYDGYWYMLQFTQNGENQLTRGRNTVAASLLNYETTFEVNIVESPVERIEFEPLTVLENDNGFWESHYDPVTGEALSSYFIYNLYPQFTVYFKDGTSVTSEGGDGAEYCGEWYSFYSIQDSDNPLTLGTHTVTGGLMGYETTFEVTIVDTFIDHIDVEPMTFVENCNGYWDGYYETAGIRQEYFYYEIYPTFTVYFKDGTTKSCHANNWVEYNGTDYYLEINQDSDHQLVLGANSVTCSLMNYDFTIDVQIIESPIDRIEFEPMTLIENSDGYWDSYYDEETDSWKDYFNYDIDPSFTVYFKDGTSENYGNSCWIDYCGQSYYISIIQDKEHQLAPGANTVACSVMGYETTFEVNVTDTPIERIEMEPMEIVQNTNGYFDSYYDEESDSYQDYFYYQLYPNFTVYFKDGTSQTYRGTRWIEYNGGSYSMTIAQNGQNQLTLGTNTVAVNLMNFETSFEVTIIDNPIERIEFEPLEIIENTNGYINSSYDYETESQQEYYYYNLYPNFTVYFKDGTSISNNGDSGITYNGSWYSLEMNQGYANRLTLGANTVTASLMEFETSFTVNIVETPIERVEIETLELIENTNGWINNRWDDETQSYIEYYYYEMYPDFTVYFKDGTSISNEPGCRYIYYNDTEYILDDDQNKGNPLSLGVNTLNATLMGFEFTQDVTVIESPVERIEFAPLEIIENTRGHFDFGYDEETDSYQEYFYYNLYPDFTVYLKDGTSISNEGNSGIRYNDIWYPLNKIQNYENRLTLGSNSVSASLMGFETSFEVSIVENPIERIEVQPLKIIKETNGYWEYYYDEELGEEQQYFYYHLNPRYTVYLKDGTTLESNEDGQVCLNGYWYSLDCYQYYENKLTLGTNTVTAELLDVETTFEVTIIEHPVDRIEVEPIEIIQNTEGYWASHYDQETHTWLEYYYYWLNPVYTVYLKDGTALTSDENGNIYYNDTQYSLSYSLGYENRLTLGSNTISAEIMGAETEFEVKILETPIERIEFEPQKIIENTRGYFNSYYDYDTDSWEEYFYYYLYPSFTVYFKDGTSASYEESRWITYGDTEYYLECVQNHSNRLTLGDNQIKASVLGFETTMEITVVETPIERIEFEPLEIYENTNGFTASYYDEELQTQIEYYYYYLVPQYTVYFKDGTTATADYEGDIHYNDRWYGINFVQDYETRLTMGTNTVKGSLLGFDLTMEVNITESPYASVEILEVDTIRQNDYSHWSEDWEGNRTYYYDIPHFTYKVTLKDGTSFTASTEDGWDDSLEVGDYQGETPWTVGSTNEFYIVYAGLQATGYVTMLEPIYFEYFKQDGGVYITGCSMTDATVTIPEEIDGLPVVGLSSLDGVYYTLEHLILPDSLTYINEQGFGRHPNLKTITIGSNITYLTVEMFESYDSLEAIYIAEDNEAFIDVDGVVYNKAMDTLVFYPLPSDMENPVYYVPATVTNIDAISGAKYANLSVIFDENSTAYKTIDGVTYSADMTRILSCQKDKTGAYVMPDTVTQISANAFNECTGLTEITISPKVTEIAYCTFLNCSALSAVNMPDSVTAIDGYAFANCEMLTEIDLSDTLEVVGESAFYNTGLTALTLPDSVLAVMATAFTKTDIATLHLGNSLQFIGDSAFYGIPIQTLTLPDSFVESGSHIFARCTRLTEINFGSKLAGISTYSFTGCTALKSVTLPKNIMYVHSGAFSGCSSLEKVDFKSEEVYFGDYVFNNCALKTLKLGNKVEAISEYGFAGNDFTEVTLPDSVTYIAYSAFKNCTDLAKIDIPSSVTAIGDDSFNNTAWYEAQENGAIYLEHVLYDYKNYVEGQNILEIKPGTTVIADGALDRQYKLEHITLPEGLTNIGVEAFYHCENLQELFIPEGVTEIPYGAFFGCDSMTSLVLPSTIEYIDYCVYDTALTHILFMGTEEQWSQLYIDYELRNVPVHFGTPELLTKKNATCTTPGYTVYGCPECDATHTVYTEAMGHTPSGKPTVTPATCSAYGSESGYCKTCKSYYTLQLPKAEHTFADGKCSACDLAEIRSAHPYANDMDQTWTYTETGATQISVTFHPMTRLEDKECDSITIYDGEDNIIGVYGKTELAGETVVVPGDTFKIRLVTDYSWQYYGFEVTNIVAEHVLTSNDVKLATKPNTLEPEVELIAEVTEIAPEIQRPAGLEESRSFAYDITLEKDGAPVQPNGDVEVTLPVPQTMDGSSCQVFHVDDEGNWTNMNANYKDGELTFTTNHFSQYVIMEAFDTGSAVRIMQHLIGMDVDINVDAIDRNGDQMLTIADAVLLLRSLL